MAAEDLTRFFETHLYEAQRAAEALEDATKMAGKQPDFWGCGGPAAEAYWAYFIPRLMLADIAAKRAVLAIHEPLPSMYGEPPVCGACWPEPRIGTHPLWPCSTVRALAAGLNHPDYAEERKP